jgi:hypothetical protein
MLLATTTGLLGGCKLPDVGGGTAGTIEYVNGDLEVIDVNRLNAAYQATKTALQEMGLYIVKDSKDATSAVITARDRQDSRITIRLKTTVEGPTNISIRVGNFGDESMSRQIYDQIKKNLPFKEAGIP